LVNKHDIFKPPAKSSFNTQQLLRRLGAARGSVGWVGRYARFPSLPHPHFASPGFAYAKPLFGLAKRQLFLTLSAIILR